MNNIMKVVESLEESGLLIKGVSKTIKSKAKEQKRIFQHVIRRIFQHFSIAYCKVLVYSEIC